MAVKYWLGGDSGNETDGSVAANWEAAVVPADGDEIHLDGRAGVDPATGKHWALVTTFTGTPDLDLFHVHSTYNGNIGGDATQIAMNLDNGRLIYEGSGDAYILLSEGAAADAKCPLAAINSAGGLLQLESYINSSSNHCIFEEIIALAGNLVIHDDACVALLRILHSSATVTIGTGVELVDSAIYFGEASYYGQNPAGMRMMIDQRTGVCTSDSKLCTAINALLTANAASTTSVIDLTGDVTAQFPVGSFVYHTTDLTWHLITISSFGATTSITVTPTAATQWDSLTVRAGWPAYEKLKLYGGIFNWGTLANAGEAGMDAGVIEVHKDATFNWTVDDAATSIIGQIKAFYGGKFDASLDLNNNGLRQIGSTRDEISELWSGGIIKLNGTAPGLISIEGSSTIKNMGGVLYLPDDTEVSW